MLEKYLDIKEEVIEALKNNKPVVALESTIISHGMPYPQNAETALKVEEIVRENGAVPATIAIMDGKLKVGLSKEEIEYLGRKGHEVIKCSRRDIPFILAKKVDGATTVASTMIIAALAGVKVFATGGIGGVHRGAQETFDISADLEELARTNVAVICAGAKSILDIGLTLEYLETKGVPVVGYKTDELPAFYTRKSGFGVDYRVDSPKELAAALKAKWDIGLNGGMVVANPVQEEYQMDYDIITNAIEEALKQASEKGIKGKESTPFLLAKVKELTGGDSLESNIKLVYNNAEVASKVAVQLSLMH
ncbi:pseudouridine-5'-phosphate glycosidase [Clostridium sp. DL1XJH146]